MCICLTAIKLLGRQWTSKTCKLNFSLLCIYSRYLVNIFFFSWMRIIIFSPTKHFSFIIQTLKTDTVVEEAIVVAEELSCKGENWGNCLLSERLTMACWNWLKSFYRNALLTLSALVFLTYKLVEAGTLLEKYIEKHYESTDARYRGDWSFL